MIPNVLMALPGCRSRVFHRHHHHHRDPHLDDRHGVAVPRGLSRGRQHPHLPNRRRSRPRPRSIHESLLIAVVVVVVVVVVVQESSAC